MKKLLFLLLFIPLVVSSQIPEPEKGTYVNDQYGYLNQTDKLTINKQLRYIEDSTGVQVAIILIPTVPDKYSIEDYANEIGRKWHVGNAKNGIVYVAAIDQRKQRMEVANHLEGTITDAIAGRLLATTRPYFRSQKYGEGVINMILQLQIEILKDKKEQKALTGAELKKKNAQGLPWWMAFLLIPVCLGIPSVVIFRIIRKRREKKRLEEHEALLKRVQQEAEADRKSYELAKKSIETHQANQENKKYNKYGQPLSRTNIISDDPALIIPPPEIYTPPSRSYDEDNYSSKSSGSGYSSGSSGSDSGSSSSSDYGSWGSSSSDSGSSSSDSGYSGGGASDSW